MKTKNIVISVPESLMEKNPEVVKSCVERRMASGRTKSKSRGVIALVLCAATALSLMVAALAGSQKPVETLPETGAPKVVYIRELITWVLSDEDRALVESAVMAVAGGESKLCQQAAAQAIRNACEDYGLSVRDVIDEWKYPLASGEVTDEVKAAVDYVVEHNAVNERLHSFYNPAVQDGSWHENCQTFVIQIGNVRFFA